MKAAMQTHFSSQKAQQGFTLVELLVAMTLGLLITLAAASALLVSRQGFFSVDAASQLRDNARYAQDIVQRLGIQAGFKNVFFMKGGSGAASGLDPNPPPHVYGLNDLKRATSSVSWDAGTSWGTNDLGKNSDILVLRAQASTAAENSTATDGTMIDCLGVAPTALPTSGDDRFISILHVQTSSDGEPALMCTRDTGSGFETQPLVQGVESFQVLYGVDNVVPGTAPSGATDSVPERYLRADQLTVSGNAVATYANWRRVRSLRIGMVLRSQAGSAVDADTQTYYPLGSSKSSAGGAVGSAFANATNDPGTVFTPAADRRIRQVLTFTVHLRNFQGLETN